MRRTRGRILDWLGLEAEERCEHWQHWCEEFLTKEGKPRAPSQFASKAVTDAHPGLERSFLDECDRVVAAIDACLALKVAAVSAALMTLAKPVLQAYAEHKDTSGLLDYNDLIGRTSNLLVDPGAAWVLYKLDGGLDHLLLDEVQDTAPEQWRIAHALTAEFFAGATARDVHRTVFAVGDRKQSIYSFQGADVDAFDQSHQLLRERVGAAGKPWQDATLDVSFRSTKPVLELVDRVFANPTAAAGVVDAGVALTHYADRADHAGVVELWPLAPLPDAEEPEPWTVPEQNRGLTSAPQILAETLARWIAREVSGGVMLESRGRALAPGDVMVLVRRRNDFGRALVRSLKSLGVPVAGLDRLMLTEQPAVQDLMALADALLLPQDDLTFACLLTSPLGGLSDDSLADLAIGRNAPLWETLHARAEERPDWQAAWAFFTALLARVDFVSPHALFAEALGPLRGRARLFARLGPEAAEPVDELLNAALAYGRMHPLSLQGFLHWLRRSGAEVKREAEGAGSLVRVMTVHGAKGLQAPLVILPDTTSLPPDEGSIRGKRSGDWARRADLVATAGRTLCRRPGVARSGEAAADGGAQPVALCRADPRRGPAAGVRLADAARVGWCVLVSAGGTRLRHAAGGSLDLRRLGWRTATFRHAAGREARWTGRQGEEASGRRPAALGRHGARLARRCPARRTGPAGTAGSEPAGECRAWAGAGRRHATGGTRGGEQPVPPWHVAARAAAASAGPAAGATCFGGAGVAGPARQRPSLRRGRDAGPRGAGDHRPPRTWAVVRAGQPGRSAADGTGQRSGGRRAGGSAGGAGRSRDRGRLQDQPPAAGPPARTRPSLYRRQMAAYRAVLRDIFPAMPSDAR